MNSQRKRLIIIVSCLLVFTLVALLGDILGKKTGKVVKKNEKGEETDLRCSYDGTKIKPLYQVDVFLNDNTGLSFCSIYCAARWFESNKDKVKYFIAQYAELFNIRFIIMSATLPRIDEIELSDYKPKQFISLIPNANAYLQNPNFAGRVKIITKLLNLSFFFVQ